MIEKYLKLVKSNGYFKQNRQNQSVQIMFETINQRLMDDFHHNQKIKNYAEKLKQDILNHKISSYVAAQLLLEKYLGSFRSKSIFQE